MAPGIPGDSPPARARSRSARRGLPLDVEAVTLVLICESGFSSLTLWAASWWASHDRLDRAGALVAAQLSG